MSDSLQTIIAEREMQEAIESRYNKTINKHRWTNLDNIKLSTSEIVAKYISECDQEDEGVYRNHIFKATLYQQRWKDFLMQKEYKYMITIKLPHRTIDGYKRTINQTAAVEQIRKLIREIEQAYTGHKHFERDAFDFNLVFEHGESGFWHAHLAVVSNTLHYETHYNRLQEAIDIVLQKHKLFNSCIKLTYVYDQEGLCLYLIKELQDQDSNNLQKEYSYLSNLHGLFHIAIKEKVSTADNNTELGKILKMISAAYKLKKNHLLYRPNPIRKLNRI